MLMIDLKVLRDLISLSSISNKQMSVSVTKRISFVMGFKSKLLMDLDKKVDCELLDWEYHIGML